MTEDPVIGRASPLSKQRILPGFKALMVHVIAQHAGKPPVLRCDEDPIAPTPVAARHAPKEHQKTTGDPASAYREIVAGVGTGLRPGGWLLLETGVEASGPALQVLAECPDLVGSELRHDDAGLPQITDRVLLPELEAHAERPDLPASQIVRREVFAKVAKEQMAVRKLLIWKTNKDHVDPSYPAFVVHWTAPLALLLLGSLLLAGSYFGGSDAPGWILIAGVWLVVFGSGAALRDVVERRRR